MPTTPIAATRINGVREGIQDLPSAGDLGGRPTT